MEPPTELELALGIARQLATGSDVRRQVCDAARAGAGADWAALVEREGEALVITAADGLLEGVVRARIEPGTGGVGRAFASGQQRFSADARADGVLDARLVHATGTGAVLHQPLRHGGETLGVLAVGWSRPRRRPPLAVRRLLELLALDAAIAIEREQLVARLAAEARTDALTGLANRRAWEESAPRELSRAARHGLSVTLALIDLDDFKQLNDTHGHAAGDALLRAVAARWRAALRDADLLARFGGDEFALLLVPSAAESGETIVRRLLERLPDGVTCSAGIVAAAGSADGSRLLQRADEALYAAKAAGKGRIVAAGPAGPVAAAQATSRSRPLSTS
ncbi:sensor domain-containing diguanylate cyclase [Conexibacter stalactiti]|uniref:Sensor domain-containing diguanylate cyclase n=1 Tax=Conexibacter stalactiti TaxID=1940611 RepID=A0ABU4HK62_9ACTN|nr:sensor domain-containing diguanylate cyclase [Conexibacter stalactiti]MDW5592940.1 sensor domain-containing diguanylate cyclase [Conexibacter stalactiti]MEC5033581.1 sensor domain-containing diguanylate cyclase [Conexibacter stalactiti]